MTSMKFFGFLNEDSSVTRVVLKNDIVLPIGVPVWGKDGPPKRMEFTQLEKIAPERSMLSGHKYDGLIILGLFEYLFILVDQDGLCYSVDFYDRESTSK